MVVKAILYRITLNFVFRSFLLILCCIQNKVVNFKESKYLKHIFASYLS